MNSTNNLFFSIKHEDMHKNKNVAIVNGAVIYLYLNTANKSQFSVTHVFDIWFYGQNPLFSLKEQANEFFFSGERSKYDLNNANKSHAWKKLYLIYTSLDVNPLYRFSGDLIIDINERSVIKLLLILDLVSLKD
ncbi:hypothetical protein ACJX0J_039979 [Zea mays]